MNRFRIALLAHLRRAGERDVRSCWLGLSLAGAAALFAPSALAVTAPIAERAPYVGGLPELAPEGVLAFGQVSPFAKLVEPIAIYVRNEAGGIMQIQGTERPVSLLLTDEPSVVTQELTIWTPNTPWQPGQELTAPALTVVEFEEGDFPQLRIISATATLQAISVQGALCEGTYANGQPGASVFSTHERFRRSVAVQLEFIADRPMLSQVMFRIAGPSKTELFYGPTLLNDNPLTTNVEIKEGEEQCAYPQLADIRTGEIFDFGPACDDTDLGFVGPQKAAPRSGGYQSIGMHCAPRGGATQSALVRASGGLECSRRLPRSDTSRNR